MLYKMPTSRKIIAFEGLDCSFKETNCREFYKRFKETYIFRDVRTESFPRYSDQTASYFLRGWLDGRYDRPYLKNHPKAIDSMYSLDRFDFWFKPDEFYRTQYEAEATFIFDRYSLSNAIYNPINGQEATVEDYIFDRDTFGVPNPDIIVWMRMKSFKTLSNLIARKKNKDKNELDITYLKMIHTRSEHMVHSHIFEKHPEIGVKKFVVIDCIDYNNQLKSRETLAEEVYEKTIEAYVEVEKEKHRNARKNVEEPIE